LAASHPYHQFFDAMYSEVWKHKFLFKYQDWFVKKFSAHFGHSSMK